MGQDLVARGFAFGARAGAQDQFLGVAGGDFEGCLIALLLVPPR
jgi:hypothetical protein